VTWAQNDAAIEAYMNGIEYIYRINDDTDMETSGLLLASKHKKAESYLKSSFESS
jgi:23S rRNA-/tRNA-specific pseudouridylate synthase